MTYELFIQHGTSLLLPPVVDGVTVEWDRRGQPGKLTFKCIITDGQSITEGDACRLSVNGSPFFYGFVFDIAQSGSSRETLQLTVYDQLYYLTNKDYIQYSNKTADEVVRMLAEDYGLRVGALASTGYRIASRTEDGKSLFDIIQNALDATTKATAQLYVLYDNVGRLTLTGVSDMKLGLLVDDTTAGDYDYKSTIADGTYNKIRLVREGSAPVIVKDSSTIRQWGVLQHVEKVDDENANLSSMASALLNLYNDKTKTLSVKKVLGDTRVRAGTLLPVVLDVGDTKISKYLMVEQVKHEFRDNQHLMTMKLRGGTFVA